MSIPPVPLPPTDIAPAFKVPLDRFSPDQWWRAISLIVLALLMALTWIPWQPSLPADVLGASAAITVHEAFRTGMDSGQELVSPAGPWGILAGGYHPATYVFVVGAWILIAAVTFAGLWTIGQARFRHPRSAALWMLGIVALGAAPTPWSIHVRLLLPVCLLLAICLYDDRPLGLLKVLLAAAVVLVGLCQFSKLLLAAGIVLVLALDRGLRRKRIPWVGIAFLLCIPVLWLLAGQSLGGLPAYIANSLHFAAGYASAMGLSLPSEARDVGLYLLTSAGLVAWVAVEARQRGRWAAAPILATLLVVHSLFRTGYVHHSANELVAGLGLSVLLLLYAPLLWKSNASRIARVALGMALLLSLVMADLMLRRWERAGLPVAYGRAIAQVPSRIGATVRFMAGHPTIEEQHQQDLARFHAAAPLPRASGTVDAYPWNQGALIAMRLGRSPRPVFQSHLSFTPRLLEMNARHLESPAAPSNILLDVQSLDGRLPSLHDAASWPALLARYDVQRIFGACLLLQRLRDAGTWSLQPLGQQALPFNTFVQVPALAEGPLWAQIDVRLSLVGRLAQLAYKPPAVVLELRTFDGNTSRWRLVPTIARQGFLLSPLVANRLGWSLLKSAEWKPALQAAHVTHLRITLADKPGPGACYSSNASLTLHTLRFGHQDPATIGNLMNAVASTAFLPRLTSPTNTPLSLATGPDDLPVVVVRPKQDLSMKMDPSAQAVRVRFGMGNIAWQGAQKSEGLKFVLAGIDEAGRTTILWWRVLNPAQNPQDRGPLDADVPLQGRKFTSLLLATLLPDGATAHPQADLGYWAYVHPLRPQ